APPARVPSGSARPRGARAGRIAPALNACVGPCRDSTRLGNAVAGGRLTGPAEALRARMASRPGAIATPCPSTGAASLSRGDTLTTERPTGRPPAKTVRGTVVMPPATPRLA